MKKILIIEDNKDVSNLLYFLFSSEKYHVKQCFDGESGMKGFLDFSPDVVLLDILLPKMDGREILANIQSLHIRPEVIVFSSSGWEGVQAENVHYCPKSLFSPEKIKTFVDTLVQV